jgi:uncharacterized lipoprotein YddW (UPF0748 family)
MKDSLHALGITRSLFTAALAVTLAVGTAAVSFAAGPEHRGVWMHASYIKTPAEADRCVALMERANFNAVYLLVWYWGGQAAFQSQLSPMLEGVQPGYDPLGYMIQECHRRQIEVHAWFVNGYHGTDTPMRVLAEHPDWAVDYGDTPGRLWYDLAKPEVRKFQSDLMIETLTRYDLDGLHFDYIRYHHSYPGICYCKHCQTEFATRYGCGPFEKQSRKAYPFAGPMVGNPVSGPTTAQVLARFSDGLPAIATNELGKGKVLLFNWHALRSVETPVAETWSRALRQWNASPENVVVMDTAPNRQHYGDKGTKEAAAALQRFGCKARIVAEDRLKELPPGSVVVLSDVYLIPDAVAAALERFVREGGRLVVVDGPARSIHNASIQRLLGMTRAGAWFSRFDLVEPVGTSELVPSDGAKIDLRQHLAKLDKWAEYRKATVTELVSDVRRRARQVKPKAMITAAVFTPRASADRVYQDWPRWLREGLVDYVLPMAYTPHNSQLAKQIQDWQAVAPRLDRIVPGLCLSQADSQDAYGYRDISLIFAQYRMCQEAGARGVNFYALDNTDASPKLMLTEPLITALRTGPFAEKVPARPQEK